MRKHDATTERPRTAPQPRRPRTPGEYAGEDGQGREYRLIEGQIYSLHDDAGRASWVCDLVAPNRRRGSTPRSGGRRHSRPKPAP